MSAMSDLNEPTFGKEEDVGTVVEPCVRLLNGVFQPNGNMVGALSTSIAASENIKVEAHEFGEAGTSQQDMHVHVHVHFDTTQLVKDVVAQVNRDVARSVNRQQFRGLGQNGAGS